MDGRERDTIGADGEPVARENTGERPEGRPPAAHVLAVYGTLRPDESNFDVVAGIGGHWFTGTIRGHLFAKESGPYAGYPAVALDPAGDHVPVAFLVSGELPHHWPRLDAFEGPGYRRVEVEVSADAASGAPLDRYRASIYEVAPDSSLS